MKNTLLLLFTILIGFSAQAQSNQKETLSQVEKALNDYILGTSYSNQKQVENAFDENANLYLTKGTGAHLILSQEIKMHFLNEIMEYY
ncbi:MAG: hypothetical protein ACI81T_001421 [Bacteroidia bacterium]|jgi:hypothetical protein